MKFSGGWERPVRYMDSNATAQLSPGSRRVVEEWLKKGVSANPSSPHGWGRLARSEVEDARRGIAEVFGVGPTSVIFTSGATEGLAIAIRAAQQRSGRSMPAIVSDGLHSAARFPLSSNPMGPESARIPFRAGGQWNLAHPEWREQLKSSEPQWGLVTLAQHESGSVFPIDSFREIAPELPLVMDAAQAFGKIALHPERLGTGWVVISGHKIGGLSGVGAVVSIGQNWPSGMIGEGQERGIRPGTEFGLGIQALAEAIRGVPERIATYRVTEGHRDQLEKQVRKIEGSNRWRTKYPTAQYHPASGGGSGRG